MESYKTIISTPQTTEAASKKYVCYKRIIKKADGTKLVSYKKIINKGA